MAFPKALSSTKCCPLSNPEESFISHWFPPWRIRSHQGTSVVTGAFWAHGRAGSHSSREEEGKKFREAVAGRGGSAKKPLKLYWQRSRIVWEGGWKALCDSWDSNAVVCSSGHTTCAFIWPWGQVGYRGRLCATVLELSHVPLCEILWQFVLPWVIVSLKLITGKGSQRDTEVALCYLCLTGLLMSVTTEVSSSRNVILGFGCSVAEVCSAFVSSQAETQHCQVVSRLTMSLLKGFGCTLIHLYNHVRARKDWGMLLRNKFSGHMCTKSLLN